MDILSFASGDILLKVAVFLLVQALVYLILSSSSSIFSPESRLRAVSFRSVRSVSMRRILAAISDLPAGGETSPSASSAPASSRTSLISRTRSYFSDSESSRQ